MAWQLTVGHCVWALLQLEHLEVHTPTLVRDNEVGVHWALGAARLVPVGEEDKETSCTLRVLIREYTLKMIETVLNICTFHFVSHYSFLRC